jgi:hypothetical protein
VFAADLPNDQKARLVQIFGGDLYHLKKKGKRPEGFFKKPNCAAQTFGTVPLSPSY